MAYCSIHLLSPFPAITPIKAACCGEKPDNNSISDNISLAVLIK